MKSVMLLDNIATLMHLSIQTIQLGQILVIAHFWPCESHICMQTSMEAWRPPGMAIRQTARKHLPHHAAAWGPWGHPPGSQPGQ